ncbi:MAG: hypothetical protein ABI591_11730 [Kofleriaceae bacterium]
MIVVCGLASIAAAKPSIAVLGLEVLDKSGTPSNDDVQFAKNLTEGLRARAKIGGPYTLAPTGDKELIDLKLLKGCDDEKPSCMSSIGGDLNADFLIYGSVTKRKGGYDISVAFLDVHAGKRERTIPTSVTVGTSGVALQNSAKKIYNGLTGQSDSCTITIKTPGVDRGTILINGKEAGNITNGVGSVNGLSEGKYAIAIEANNFHRYTKGDVQCTGGETTNIQATLDKSDKAVPPPDKFIPPDNGDQNPPGGTEIGHTNTVSHHGNTSKTVWTVIGSVGLASVVGGGIVFGIGYSNVSSFDHKGTVLVNGVADPTYDSSKCGKDTAIENANPDYKSACTGKTETWIGGVMIGAGAVIAIGGYLMAAHSSHEEDPAQVSGRRKHHEPFAITPVVSPTGGGATFRVEW